MWHDNWYVSVGRRVSQRDLRTVVRRTVKIRHLLQPQGQEVPYLSVLINTPVPDKRVQTRLSPTGGFRTMHLAGPSSYVDAFCKNWMYHCRLVHASVNHCSVVCTVPPPCSFAAGRVVLPRRALNMLALGLPTSDHSPCDRNPVSAHEQCICE